MTFCLRSVSLAHPFVVRAGSYRDVFLVKHQTAVDLDMVLKVAEIENDYDHEIYECMRMEGAVTAHLSPHPLLVDIYVSAMCAPKMSCVRSFWIHLTLYWTFRGSARYPCLVKP